MLAFELKKLGYISSVIPVFESKEMCDEGKRLILQSLSKTSPATSEACIDFLRQLRIPTDQIDAQAIRDQKISDLYAKFC